MLPKEYDLPMFALSPAEIFSGQVPVFDINFINPTEYKDEDGNVIETPATQLHDTIANWYVALRNLVLVLFMIVLLYIGIRIVISSTASEKAKYKAHIKDWLIGLIIVVFMHYIMAFSIEIVNRVTSFLVTKNEVVKAEIPEVEIDEDSDAAQYIEQEDGKTRVRTNLIGLAKLEAQQIKNSHGFTTSSWDEIGYTIVYIMLVIYTLTFSIKYLKRVVYMAFLTVLAPIVSLTYPIDKLNDGKSQAFDMWLKEYMFNLLLQPLHLLIYTVTVGSAMEIAEENMLYAIVAIAFIFQVERLMRKFFGFEKSETAGKVMSGALGGAMAMQAINTVTGFMKKSGGSGSKGGNGGSGNSEGFIRKADRGRSTDSLLDEGFGAGNNGGSSGNGQPQQTRLVDGNSGQDNNSDVDNNPENNMSELPEGYAETSSGIAIPRNTPTRRTNNMSELPEGYAETSSGIAIPRNTPTRRTNNIETNPENNQRNTTGIEGQQPQQGLGTEAEDRRQGSNFELPYMAANGLRGLGNRIGATGVGQFGKSAAERVNNTGVKLKGFGNNIKEKAARSKLNNPLTRDVKRLAIRGVKTGAALANTYGDKVARGYLKALGAGAIGLTAAAAGATTDDFSNTFKYGATGIGAGIAVGDKPVDIAESAVKKAKESRNRYYENRYTPSEMQERLNKQADKKFLKDKEKIKMYKDKFGAENYKQKMQEALEYRKYGVTDDKMIIKAMKLENLRDANATSKERISYAKIASSAQSEDQLNAYGERLKSRGIEQNKINNILNTVRGMQD